MAQVKDTHRVATIIMYAMMASLVLYIVIVEVLNRTSAEPERLQQVDLIRYIFYAMAVAMIFMAQLIKALMLRGLHGAGIDVALARLQASNLIAALLAETPALLGLVMYIVWRQYTDFYILTFVSLYIMVRHFPRWAAWQRVVGAATGGA